MDDVSILINAYVAASGEAQVELEKRSGLTLESFDIQQALCEVLDIKNDNPAYLLDHQLTSERIVELLSSYNFRKNKPEVLGEITLEESILPKGTPKLLTEETLRVKGEVWRIHQNDADPFPSTPHAHNLESGVVLHLGNGDLFGKKRKHIGNIGCKRLLTIRALLTKFALPATQCT